MKKTILATIVCATITLLQLACGPSNAKQAKGGHAAESGNNCPLSQTSGFTLTGTEMHPNFTSIDTAKADVRRLDSLLMSVFGRNSVPVRAFNLNTHDILFAHGIQVDTTLTKFHTRAYMGIASDLKTFKLYILPVTGSSGKEITESNPGNDIMVAFNVTQPRDTTIYCALELNTPCPNTCDPASPLYINFPN